MRKSFQTLRDNSLFLGEELSSLRFPALVGVWLGVFAYYVVVTISSPMKHNTNVMKCVEHALYSLGITPLSLSIIRSVGLVD